MIRKINWLAIPGGPGLSKRYLTNALSKLDPFLRGSLSSYDPLGSPECPCDPSPDPSQMVDQIFQLVKKKRMTDIGLVTHSFGNYIALRAIEQGLPVDALLMISPIPFQFSHWKDALERIVSSVPEAVLAEINRLSGSDGDGSELFGKLLPYYTVNPGIDIKVPFDIKSCNDISDKVTSYDDRDLVFSLSMPVLRIVGDEDPFFSERDFMQDRTIVIPGVGHYPFLEDKKSFFNALKESEDILCQNVNTALKTRRHF